MPGSLIALQRGLLPGSFIALRPAIRSACGIQDSVQQFIHPGIQILHGQAPALNCFHKFPGGAKPGGRHLQIRTGTYRRSMVIGPAPVGDDKAVILPFPAQDLLQKVHVLIGIFAIHLVVGGHECSGMALLQGNLKPGQVDLPQGALIHNGIHRHAALFLGIDRKMLEAGVYPLALDASHIPRRHLSRKVRILRKIFKIPSTQRIAFDVHARAQQDVYAQCPGFLPQRFPDLLPQFRIPAVGHGCSSREAGRRDGLIQPQVVSCPRLPAQAVRAVRHDHGRNPQAGNRPCIPHSLSAKQRCFLLQRQLVNQVLMLHIISPCPVWIVTVILFFPLKYLASR